MQSRFVGGFLAVTLAAVVTAGCSDSSSAPQATSQGAPTPPPAAAEPTVAVAPEHNIADITFVQGMIPHHLQAIAMSTQVPSRAASQQVKDLANRIDRAQAPEISQMNQMLDAWGAPRPQPGSEMPGHGMPMGEMPGQAHGMMSDAQMQLLAAQSGAAFDRMFLQMMIEHHNGAIQMAQTEVGQGQNPRAKQLAAAIVGQQQQEITEMQALLARV